MKKKLLVTLLAITLSIGTIVSATGCGANLSGQVSNTTGATSGNTNDGVNETPELAQNYDVPKYIFLFIGDGMSYPQIQAASYYTGTTENNGEIIGSDLSFMDFPSVGSAQTYDASSFAPDSASTATSIATGNKTYSGTINMDTTFTIPFEAISEKLKKQLDYKVGVVTSVNINHATPAAFYAHQESRSNYYEIGLEMIESDFDFFAGGQLLAQTGKNGDQEDLLVLAEQAGYTVKTTYADAKSLTAADGKAIIVSENADSDGAIPFALDASEEDWQLADYVQKGIEVLENDETGFFMMVESGKIDWAGHANDAAANIGDTLALNDAVAVAKEFYMAHPDETLILVTGDHETGGLSLGFAGTDYNTFLTNLEAQTMTYEDFSHKVVPSYQENNIAFAEAMNDIKEIFGLISPDDEDGIAEVGEDATVILTDYEMGLLEAAYNRTLKVGASSKDEMSQEEYNLYGTYDPFTVSLTHVLNNKSGIGWSTWAHTGMPVPVFAIGVGAELFEGYYDNTDIFFNMKHLTGVE